MPSNFLLDSVQYLKGIGPHRARALNSVGINTVEDLLYYVPRRYLDRATITPINKLEINTKATVMGIVQAFGIKKGFKSRFELILKDGTGFLTLVWFQSFRYSKYLQYLKKAFKVGDIVIASGDIRVFHGLQMPHPEYEIVSGNGDEEFIHTGRVIPLYPSTAELKKLHLDSRGFRKILKPALEKLNNQILETLPASVISEVKLLPLPEALQNVHFPENLEKAFEAKKRLAFEELFYLELMLALRKNQVQKQDGIRFKEPGQLVKNLLSRLPFELTEAQKKVAREIVNDMTSPKSMNRLLQGDVGSGKTVIALIAILVALESNYQAAFMAPTEILAEQHYQNIHPLLEEIGIKIALLTSSVVRREKEKILENTGAGNIQVVVGTHALIQKDVNFVNLGLVIVDEQHRFGVLQRAQLKEKGNSPDVLIMTATPIPRTLALTFYGDLDISVIDQMPPGRQPIETVLKDEKQKDEIYRFIDRKIEEGRQIYVVYPLIEESEKIDLKAALDGYELLKAKIFPNRKVALIHGKIKNQEREKIMRDFRKGLYDILVSTTVIEVGVDVPNATVMVIENAERFGLSQLHQLRGRVGRGGEKSYCFLMGRFPVSEDARTRLQVLCQTNDGFKISEMDLKLRGPGEFFGIRQHGFPELKIADLVTDLGLLTQARNWAFKIVETDPNLSHPENKNLRLNFLRRYKEKSVLIAVG